VPSRKIDLYAEYKKEYVAPRSPVLLTIGSAKYLTIDGQGSPGGDRFTAAIGALYGVAFTIKMTRKFGGKQDYAVAKLEALWPGDMLRPRDQWQWKLMIRTPAFVTGADLKRAITAQLDKGKHAEVKDVSLETIKEGRCVQMLHIGPYEKEDATRAAMRAFAREKGFSLAGPHHEIYLSDPRRVTPTKLKTILREPVN
jgi:hypothetical protein